MKIRSAALLAAMGVLALAGCQDQQASQGGGDAAPPTSQSSRSPAPQQGDAPAGSQAAPSSTESAPAVTRSTTQPRVAWSKEDLAKQLRSARSIPESSDITCVEGLRAKEGETTTCTVSPENETPELYAAVVKPAGVTGAMAPKFVKASREQ